MFGGIGRTLGSIGGALGGAAGSGWLGNAAKGVASIGTGGLRALNSTGQSIVRSPVFDYAMEGASVPVRTLASVGNLVRGQNPAEPWQTGKAMNEWDTWKSALLGGGLAAGGAYALTNPWYSSQGWGPITAAETGGFAGADATLPGALGAGGLGTGSFAGADAVLPGALGAGGLEGAAASAAAASELAPAALSSTAQKAALTGAGKALTSGGTSLINPYVAGGLLAGKGALSFLQAQEQKSATDPYARYSRNAMERLNQLAANPNQMYMNDPGLRQIRKNALDAVTSRQLATTGGVEGGNYARQLMAESANIDRQNLMALANLEATIAGQAAPFAQANMEIGNPAYQGMNTVLSDQAFMSVLNDLLT